MAGEFTAALGRTEERLTRLCASLKEADAAKKPPRVLLGLALLRLADWGPAEKDLREALRAQALGVQERLALVKILAAKESLSAAGEELVALLNADERAPDALLAGARDLLARRGWTAMPGEFLAIARRGRVLFRLTARRSGGRLTPSFKLGIRRAAGVRLTTVEKRAAADLSTGLCLFLESLRPRRGGEAPARAERHEESDGDRSVLRVTFACNQDCPFCFVPPPGRRAPPAVVEAELAAISKNFRRDAPLTISGGEPTVEPRLAEILRSARRKGIRRFVLQTNAVRLARPGAVEELAALGVRTYLVSFHSHRPAAYDRITGSRGQYRRAVEGLKRILRAGSGHVTCNVVVNAWNYADLPGLVDFLGKLVVGGRKLGVFFSMINGAGLYRSPAMGVKLEKAAPYLRRAVARCREAGLLVEKFGGESAFPVCLLERPEGLASRRSFSQERVRYAEDFPADGAAVGRAKRAACRNCRYDRRCLGVSVEYARTFGLRGLDPEKFPLPIACRRED